MSEAYLEGLFPKLGIVIMQRADSGDLLLLTPAPAWFADAAATAAAGGPATLGATLPFLDHIRIEADRFWWSGQEGVHDGEPFAVPGAAGDHLVRPRFITLAGRKLLLLESLTGFADSRSMLQVARDARLGQERTVLRAKEARAALDAIAGLANVLLGADLPPASRGVARDVASAVEAGRAALNAIVDPARPAG